MKKNPVVITGVGAMTALGHSADATWRALLAGEPGIRRLEGFDVDGFDCRVGAQIREFDPAALGFNSKLARIQDLHSFMLLKCSQDAFTQARLATAEIGPEDIALSVGMGMVDFKIPDLVPAVVAATDVRGGLDMDVFYTRAYQEIYPLTTLTMLNNVSVCDVAIQLSIRGENIVFSPDADSGAQAIAEGVKSVQEKKAKVALAGGVSEKISPFGLARAHLQRFLNVTDSVMPCRPFAPDRRGTVLGEGCGILSLELRETADQRGVSYTVAVTGYGAAFESDDGTPGPTPRAISRAMQGALARAEINPTDVDLVIAHGDGTQSGDANEIDALHDVFAASLERLPVFSSKGSLGHLQAGAIAVDVILGTYILIHGAIPPTLGSVARNAIGFRLVVDRPLQCAPRRLLLNCCSHEGQCASLVIEAAN
jgi:3-oxoacyl-[acyl-carrier-protein] synthase II